MKVLQAESTMLTGLQHVALRPRLCLQDVRPQCWGHVTEPRGDMEPALRDAAGGKPSVTWQPLRSVFQSA